MSEFDVESVSTDRPNIARMYDYLLGGSANFAADRQAAEDFNGAIPGNDTWAYSHAQSNRAFLGRAVRHLAAQGIDQFLDLGSGVPTVGNVHEVARWLDPRARVAYVDHEPVAVAHGRHLLRNVERTTVTEADLRDVAFYFRKKTGTPQLTDSGVADVLLGGEGLSITTHLRSAGNDKSSVFHVKDVQTSIHTLKFAVRDSKHDTLYKILTPLATGLIKKQLQRVIGNAVRTALEYIDGQLVTVRDQMAEAKASEDKSRRDVLLQQLTQRKQQAEKRAAEASVKMIIPLVLFLLPAFFSVVLGPAILGLARDAGGS